MCPLAPEMLIQVVNRRFDISITFAMKALPSAYPRTKELLYGSVKNLAIDDQAFEDL